MPKNTHTLGYFTYAHFKCDGKTHKRKIKFLGRNAYISYKGIDRRLDFTGYMNYKTNWYVYINSQHIRIHKFTL